MRKLLFGGVGCLAVSVFWDVMSTAFQGASEPDSPVSTWRIVACLIVFVLVAAGWWMIFGRDRS
jgi:hypothetical protein